MVYKNVFKNEWTDGIVDKDFTAKLVAVVYATLKLIWSTIDDFVRRLDLKGVELASFVLKKFAEWQLLTFLVISLAHIVVTLAADREVVKNILNLKNGIHFKCDIG